MEPLSVGVHSVSTLAQFKTGQTIAVWGAGPIGLLCMAVAKALGASRIVAVDINQARLDFAKSYVATDTFVPPASNAGENRAEYSKRCAKVLKQAFGIKDRGPTAIDVVIEASGAEVSIQTALFVVRTGGTYVQVRRSIVRFQFSFTSQGRNGSRRSHDPHQHAVGEGVKCQGFLPIWSEPSFLSSQVYPIQLTRPTPAW